MQNVIRINNGQGFVGRGLELGAYAMIGGLCIAQLFMGEQPIGMSEAVTALAGEALLAFVATATAPVHALWSRRQTQTGETASILQFRRRAVESEENGRKAA